MVFPQKIITLFIVSLLLCTTVPKLPANDFYLTKGRVEKTGDKVTLISPGSSVTFAFRGDTCTVNLSTEDAHEDHGYVVVEIDGKYHDRYKIGASPTPLSFDFKGDKEHILTVYKATEAANGSVLFLGSNVMMIKPQVQPKKKIEFIGDSITCGMGNDYASIPCDKGVWFDQHNAYYAYGPIVSRELGTDFILNSVSGIGMYRNWNDEHEKEAIMPDVYENLYLNKNTSKPYAFDFNPDITCIGLGTNDFSDGDGTKPRLPFNEEKYVANYIAFIKTVYKHSPKTQIVLLNSPMVSGAKNETFIKCLNRVKDAFANDKTHKPVQLFTFTSVTPHGCGYHPDIEDHKKMAGQLAPFLKKLL
ncbi:GDSL family lipase [Flavobacterium album]|uniref:GDSL family lipase n=1 Tax=Flavobacterium album TaxID=2175091 RepID=A0A2S1QXM1_9FLAO|nr:SGNH/GDSL hydrolase family protein [Flavobacterium album]AWH85160.1 GDSL family lipase [Flavobacterium album]